MWHLQFVAACLVGLKLGSWLWSLNLTASRYEEQLGAGSQLGWGQVSLSGGVWAMGRSSWRVCLLCIRRPSLHSREDFNTHTWNKKKIINELGAVAMGTCC